MQQLDLPHVLALAVAGLDCVTKGTPWYTDKEVVEAGSDRDSGYVGSFWIV